jgi:hypothetical protein
MYSSQGLQEVPVFEGDLQTFYQHQHMNNSNDGLRHKPTSLASTSSMLPEFTEYSLFEDCLDTKKVQGNLEAFVSELIKVEPPAQHGQAVNNKQNSKQYINDNVAAHSTAPSSCQFANSNNNIISQHSPHNIQASQQIASSALTISIQPTSTSNTNICHTSPVTVNHEWRQSPAAQSSGHPYIQPNGHPQPEARHDPPAYPFTTSSPSMMPAQQSSSTKISMPAISPHSPYEQNINHVQSNTQQQDTFASYNSPVGSVASPYNSPMGPCSPAQGAMHSAHNHDDFMPLRQALFNRHNSSMPTGHNNNNNNKNNNNNNNNYLEMHHNGAPPPPYAMHLGIEVSM